jgi:hypothetical protein
VRHRLETLRAIGLPHDSHVPYSPRYSRRSASLISISTAPSAEANRNAFSRSIASVPTSAMWNE